MSEHTENKLYLQFGKSSSRNFPEARRLAERFSTYKCHNSGKGRAELHEVTFKLTQENLKLLNSFLKLLQLVHAWKSAALRLNDEDVPYIYPFLNGLSEVSNCYRTKVHHELMDDYCKGKKAPTDEQTFWGCKYEKGVAILHAGYGGNSIWYQFGELSDDNKLFYIDKEQIFERLQIATKKEACLLCPAFDWERMRGSLSIIPEVIDLESDDRFEIAYSKIDPTRRIGIQKKPSELFRRLSIQTSDSDLIKAEKAKREMFR